MSILLCARQGDPGKETEIDQDSAFRMLCVCFGEVESGRLHGHTPGSSGLQNHGGRDRGHWGESQALETVSDGEWVPDGRERTREYFGEKELQKQGCKVRTLKDQRSWGQRQQLEMPPRGSRLFSTPTPQRDALLNEVPRGSFSSATPGHGLGVSSVSLMGRT